MKLDGSRWLTLAGVTRYGTGTIERWLETVIPDAMTACQEWTSWWFEMMAEDGKHLLADTQLVGELEDKLFFFFDAAVLSSDKSQALHFAHKFSSDVRSHNNHGIFEIHSPAFCIG